MIKYVPNAITLSRLLFAAGLAGSMFTGHYVTGMFLLIIGAFTDAVDGWTARRFHAESKLGKDVLEPVCDLVLVGVAILMMIYVGIWSWWSFVGIVAIGVVLQLISVFRKVSWVRPLKRHQNYLHPFYAVLVMYTVIVAYIRWFGESPWRGWLLILVSLVMLALIVTKRDRIRELYNYQED